MAKKKTNKSEAEVWEKMDPKKFRKERFMNELAQKMELGGKVGDICEDMGVILIHVEGKSYPIDTNKDNPDSINNSTGITGNEVNPPKPKASDPIDDELNENYDEALRDKINSGFDYMGPKLDDEGNIMIAEDQDDPEEAEAQKAFKESSKDGKATPGMVYRNDQLDTGFDIDTRTHPKMGPHDDADKVIYNGRTDELYGSLKLVEASTADIFNELTRRFDNIILLLKRPLIKVDDVPLSLHKTNEDLKEGEYKRTGARNDRVISCKIDNRSFCMGDPHVLFGMLSDLRIKTEEAFMSQMDHFYYDGNMASTAKTSRLAITRKKAGFKKKKKE